MYTPRAIFSRRFLHICPFVLSLYTLGRLVTLSCEISDQSPIACVNGHYSVRPPSWILSNRKWRCSIRRPRKPHPRNKHEVDRTTHRRDNMATLSSSKWPPAAILDLIEPEMVPFDPPVRRPPKPHPRTKHHRDRMARCRVMAI